MFAPEEMLLVIGSPSLRRDALDRLAGQRAPAYAAHLATYGRALQQRNGLLRLIREEQAARGDLRFWDATLLESGTAVREERHRLLDALAAPLAAAHAEIAPGGGGSRGLCASAMRPTPRSWTASRSATRWPGASPRRRRRRSGTAPR